MVTIGSAGRATDNVTQRVIMTKENEKPRWLQSELNQVDEKKAIVFVNTKRQCDNVYSLLENQGYRWGLGLRLWCCVWWCWWCRGSGRGAWLRSVLLCAVWVWPFGRVPG